MCEFVIEVIKCMNKYFMDFVLWVVKGEGVEECKSVIIKSIFEVVYVAMYFL